MSQQSFTYSYNANSLQTNPNSVLPNSYEAAKIPSYQISSNPYNQYTSTSTAISHDFAKPTSIINAGAGQTMPSVTGITSSDAPLSYHQIHSNMENKPYTHNNTSNQPDLFTTSTSNYVYPVQRVSEQKEIVSGGENVLKHTNALSFSHYGPDIGQSANQTFEASYGSSAYPASNGERTNEINFDHSRPEQAAKSAYVSHEAEWKVNPTTEQSVEKTREFSYEHSRPQVEHTRKALVTRFIDPDDLLPEARDTYQRPIVSLKDNIPEKSTEKVKQANPQKLEYHHHQTNKSINIPGEGSSEGATREFAFERSRPQVEHSRKALVTRFIDPEDLLPEARDTYQRPVISLKDQVLEKNEEKSKQAAFGNRTSQPANTIAEGSSGVAVREFSFEITRPKVDYSGKPLTTRFIDPDDLLPSAKDTYQRPVISIKDQASEKNIEKNKQAAFGQENYKQNTQPHNFDEPNEAPTDERVREFTYEISRPQVQHSKKSLVTRFIDPDDVLPSAKDTYQRPVVTLKDKIPEKSAETVKQASSQKSDRYHQTNKSVNIPGEGSSEVATREFAFERSRPQVEHSRKALVTRFIDPEDLLPEARDTYQRPVVSLKDQSSEKNVEKNKRAAFIKNEIQPHHGRALTEPSGEENVREFAYEFYRPQVQQSGKSLTTRFINPDDLLPSAENTYQRPQIGLKDKGPGRNIETTKQAIPEKTVDESGAIIREFTIEHSRPQVEHSRKALVTRFIDPEDLLPEARNTYQKPVKSVKDLPQVPERNNQVNAHAGNTREFTYEVSRPKFEHSEKSLTTRFINPENLLPSAQGIYQRPIISLKDKLPEKIDEASKPKEYNKQDYYQYLGPITTNKDVNIAPVEVPFDNGNVREFAFEVSRPKVEHSSKSLVTRFIDPTDLLPAAREIYQRPIISLKDKLPDPTFEANRPVVFEKNDYYQQLQTQISQANNASMQGMPHQNTREFSYEISRPKVEHTSKSLLTRFIDPDDLLPEARETYQTPVITQKQMISNVPQNRNPPMRQVSFENNYQQQSANSAEAEKVKKAQQVIRRVMDPDDMIPAKRKEYMRQQQEQTKKTALPSNSAMETQGNTSDTFVQREREFAYNVARSGAGDANRVTKI